MQSQNGWSTACHTRYVATQVNQCYIYEVVHLTTKPVYVLKTRFHLAFRKQMFVQTVNEILIETNIFV